MKTTSAAAALVPASCACLPEAPDRAAALLRAAWLLLASMERGQRIDAAILRSAMEEACGGSDAGGAWDWKSAYDACEAAAVLFLRRFGGAMGARAGAPNALLAMLAKVADLLPSHTRRSEESETFQQFSTPLPLAFVAATAAALMPADRVLEPSAGTGLLAIFAELAGASLVLNELAETRAGLLRHLFPGVAVTSFDAAHIDDHLGAGVTPTLVLMNPPFSALANVDRRRTDAALRHVSSALARLAEGGRLVAVTQASLAPDNPPWRNAFVRLQERGTIVFSAAVDGAVYARHGTTIETRLTVIDKRAAADATVFPASPGTAPDAATLLRWVMESVPLRLPIADAASEGTTARCERSAPGRTRARIAWVPSRPSSPSPATSGDVVELAYDTVDWKPAGGGRLSEALYEDYALQSIRIPGAHAHPTRLNPYAERKIRMTSFNIYRVRFIQSQRHAINISAPNAELAEFFAEEIRKRAGTTPFEAIGDPFSADWHSEEICSGVTPDLLAAVANALDQLRRGGPRWTIEECLANALARAKAQGSLS